MKTFVVKKNEIAHDWFIIDAKGKILGRLASEVARLLRGKHKPEFTPHIDIGDYVIIINAIQIIVTGNKLIGKKYFRHTGYPGGIHVTNFKDMKNKNPSHIIQKAIKGMLPSGPLGYAMLEKLRVYDGEEHPHISQKPKLLMI